jgi:hypothetical protein
MLRRTRTALVATAIIAALVVLALAHAGRLSRLEHDWAWLTLGVLFALHVAFDIRRGRTRDPTDVYSQNALDDVVRSAPHPSLFWVVIALKSLAAAVVIGAALADLLGVWNF